MIAAKNNNNGVKDICKANEKTFNGNKIVLVTGGDGGVGLAFYQEMPFNISSTTIALVPKIKLNKKIGTYIALELSKYKQKYSRGFGWNKTRINTDTIKLPVNDGIDYEYIEGLFD